MYMRLFHTYEMLFMKLGNKKSCICVFRELQVLNDGKIVGSIRYCDIKVEQICVSNITTGLPRTKITGVF